MVVRLLKKLLYFFWNINFYYHCSQRPAERTCTEPHEYSLNNYLQFIKIHIKFFLLFPYISRKSLPFVFFQLKFFKHSSGFATPCPYVIIFFLLIRVISGETYRL